QRRPIEVAHPHPHGDIPRVADGPVVVIRLRRAGLDRDRKREVETAAAAENESTRVRIAQDDGYPESRPRTDDLTLGIVFGFASTRQDRGRPAPRSAPREDRVSRNDLVEAYLGVPEREAEAVVRGCPIERRKTRAIQEPEQARYADFG